jgi:hypothetical protein
MVLLPEGLKALKEVAKEIGLDLRGAYLNLDGGFDSTRNRKCIFNAGLGFDHGAGHSLLLLYDAKTSLGENINDFNSLGYDISIAPTSLF